MLSCDYFFFFKQKTAYEMRISDWSSDVCSSDLLVSAPVTDDQGRLIGRVTISEVVDVIQEDSQEQALSRAGLQEEDIFAPVLNAIKNRAPWLLINLCTASTASFIASRFENTVSHIVIRSEEHTSELQSLMRISYAVFCLKKKKTK